MKEGREKVLGNCRVLRSLGQELHSLEDACVTLGFKHLAGELSYLKLKLQESREEIEAAMSDMVDDAFQASQKALGDTLRCLVDSAEKPEGEVLLEDETDKRPPWLRFT